MASGLIDTQISEIKPLTSLQGYDAEISEVNPETDTVAAQMNTLLSKESPYITRARTSAAQYANTRGLLNSSMAAGAGEASAIDAALPIASQDANIFNTTRLTNQSAKNRGFEFTAGSQNQGALTAFQANKALESQKLSGEQALQQIGASGEQQRLNIGTQTGANLQLLAQEFANQKELTAAQFAQQRAQTILQGEVQQGLITTEAQYRERLAQIQGEIEKALSAQSYQQQLGTMGFQEEVNTRLATLQNSFAESQARLQADLQAGVIMQADYEIKSKLLTQSQQNQLETLQAQAAINQQMVQLEADLQTGQIMPAQFEQQKALLQQQFQQSLALQTAQNDFAAVLQQMKGTQATELANIEGAFKTLIQTSASASSLYQDITRQLTLIYSSPDLSADQKAIAAGNIASMLESGLTIIGSIADLNLAGLLDFTGAV